MDKITAAVLKVVILAWADWLRSPVGTEQPRHTFAEIAKAAKVSEEEASKAYTYLSGGPSPALTSINAKGEKKRVVPIWQAWANACKAIVQGFGHDKTLALTDGMVRWGFTTFSVDSDEVETVAFHRESRLSSIYEDLDVTDATVADWLLLLDALSGLETKLLVHLTETSKAYPRMERTHLNFPTHLVNYLD